MTPSSSCSCDPAAPRQLERRGLIWIIGAFLFCPCHLPLTLWWIALLASGTAIAPFLRGYSLLVGVLTTLAWLAATLHGFRQLSAARRLRSAGSPGGAS